LANTESKKLSSTSYHPSATSNLWGAATLLQKMDSLV